MGVILTHTSTSPTTTLRNSQHCAPTLFVSLHCLNETTFCDLPLPDHAMSTRQRSSNNNKLNNDNDYYYSRDYPRDYYYSRDYHCQSLVIILRSLSISLKLPVALGGTAPTHPDQRCSSCFIPLELTSTCKHLQGSTVDMTEES